MLLIHEEPSQMDVVCDDSTEGVNVTVIMTNVMALADRVIKSIHVLAVG